MSDRARSWAQLWRHPAYWSAGYAAGRGCTTTFPVRRRWSVATTTGAHCAGAWREDGRRSGWLRGCIWLRRQLGSGQRGCDNADRTHAHALRRMASR